MAQCLPHKHESLRSDPSTHGKCHVCQHISVIPALGMWGSQWNAWLANLAKSISTMFSERDPVSKNKVENIGRRLTVTSGLHIHVHMCTCTHIHITRSHTENES